MSAHAGAAEQQTAELPPQPAWRTARPPAWLAEPRATLAATVGTAGLLCLATFMAGGGLVLASMTTLELILTLLGGAIVVAAVVVLPAGTRAYGGWSVGSMLALAALTGLSVAWSVAPDASWQDAGRMLAYAAVLAAAVALARVAPGGWRALLGGIVLAAVAVCTYALLTKVLPDRLDASDTYARLQQPYGYWNAIGLTAAMGAIGCVWLGARRAGHAALTALSYPALGLMLVTLMLAYSRGSIVALAAGVVCWMCVVPLRLRAARVLIVAGLGAGPVVAWAFTRHALSSENVALGARTTAGHQLGVLLGAMLVLLALAGTAIGFFGDRRARRAGTREAAGVALAALVGLALLAAVGGLAASKRGLTGTISHDFSSLTDPNARVPNTPGRLTAVSSVRARYWKEAIQIFEAHPALGAGAAGYETARLRYRNAQLDVRHAHGYLVQTLSDLGVVGLALSLALLVAWMAAAGRATHPFNRRWTARRPKSGRSPRAGGPRLRLLPPAIAWRPIRAPYPPERIGLLAMLCVVVVFGVHSLVDWTWYVPGDALVALLCAGWLAGRGPLGRPRPVLRLPSGVGPVRAGVALAAVVGVLLAAWTEWQPQRSVEASEQALALVARNPVAALSAAQAGVARDPLSAQALLRLSAIQHATGQGTLARTTLQRAVKLQPSNPETWQALGEYDMSADPAAAVHELEAAVYLDPQSIPTQNVYVLALRAQAARQAATSAASQSRRAAGTRRGHRATGAVHERAPAQKRLRLPLANSTRRAPGRPPAPRTSTSSKPKSSKRA